MGVVPRPLALLLLLSKLILQAVVNGVTPKQVIPTTYQHDGQTNCDANVCSCVLLLSSVNVVDATTTTNHDNGGATILAEWQQGGGRE